MIFKGVCTALITPFTSEDKVNYKKLEELISYQIESGVDGILLCGTTGEAPTITDEEKAEIFKAGASIINGRVPFIAGSGTNNTKHIIELSQQAQKAGANALLINNPYYNKSSDEGIYANYEAISNEVDLPIIVYNVPSRTGKNISASLALELTKIKNVKGFKEASGNISQIAEILSKIPKDIQLFSGNDDQTLPVMALGGEGVICTCSNVIPKLCCEITDAFFEGNYELAREKQFEILPMSDALFCECNPIPVKTAMNIMGLEVGAMRLPLVDLKGSKREFLKETMRKYNLPITME